jgi:hypothetical protein
VNRKEDKLVPGQTKAMMLVAVTIVRMRSSDDYCFIDKKAVRHPAYIIRLKFLPFDFLFSFLTQLIILSIHSDVHISQWILWRGNERLEETLR